MVQLKRIAPRPLINFNALGDRINNALAHEVGVRAGMEIYSWMGAGDWCRIHWRGSENEYGQKGHDQGALQSHLTIVACLPKQGSTLGAANKTIKK